MLQRVSCQPGDSMTYRIPGQCHTERKAEALAKTIDGPEIAWKLRRYSNKSR